MPGFQLNWVVALRPEARAVIERFGLQRVDSVLFPVYENERGNTRLVVSGPGKVNAAAATATLASMENGSQPDARGWVNFGIAGCGESCFGEIRLAGKVTDGGSGNSWFPGAAWPRKFDPPTGSVLTVEKPEEDYPTDGSLVEMEAAGFFPVAIRDATIELCQVLKVVSDDPEHPIEGIDKSLAFKLCQDALNECGDWLAAFNDLGGEEAARLADPPGLVELLKVAHFSVTRQHQLRRTLQQWNARFPGVTVLETPIVDLRDAASILRELRKKLFERERES